ncbi:MAG: hypothetical protein L3J67_10290 [Hyphomicrobiaceae bacterium]|nr:hypothetical protein [Hyphomicrobiaceae bacterium]
MKIMLHKNATTTPRIREEIRNSDEPNRVLARRNNITVATVRKWKGRKDSQDLSHRPNNLQTTLNKGQEAIVVVVVLSYGLSCCRHHAGLQARNPLIATVQVSRATSSPGRVASEQSMRG